MTKYSFILLSGEKEGLLEKLQELGLVDITRSTKPVDDKTESILAHFREIDSAIKDVSKVEIPEGTLSVPAEGELLPYSKAVLSEYATLQEKLKADEKEAAAVRVWGKFSKEDLDRLERFGHKLHFHKVSAKTFKEEWAQEYPLQVIENVKGDVYFVVVGESSLPGEVPAPKHSEEDLQWQISEVSAGLAVAYGRIKGLQARVPDMEAEGKKVLSDLDLALADAASVPAAENTIDTLVGYALAENEARVDEALGELDVFYIKEAAAVSDNPPISFRNNKFVKMFEVLTDMYGRPSYDGFDPTPFIAVFFLLFFALCMGDAGYGLVLILIGLLLKKVPSFKSISPLVVTLGAGTVVVGFFLHTFFSIDIAQWSVFKPVSFLFLPDEIAGYAGGMVLAIVVGIVHLCLAMLVKAIQAVKVNGFKQSLGTLGWTLLIVGGIIVGGLALAGVLSSAATKWIIIILGVVSLIGIFPLNTWGRNPLVNTGLGLWDTYNTVTGLLGDVLSYLRLYALGLAGSMLGMAFNNMGMMVLGDGSKIVMWIPFILLVLVGHTLNIAMCALGAFVHPLRLNFLEFFKNSGYEATGRNFNPLKKTN